MEKSAASQEIRVKDVSRKLTRPVRPSEHHPLLFCPDSSFKVAKGSPRAIKGDFRALGQWVKGSGAHTAFSSLGNRE